MEDISYKVCTPRHKKLKRIYEQFYSKEHLTISVAYGEIIYAEALVEWLPRDPVVSLFVCFLLS